MQIMLMQAALPLRNPGGMELDQESAKSTYALAPIKIGRKDRLRTVIREWLEKGGHLPVRHEQGEGA
jgi:hypothetical protein